MQPSATHESTIVTGLKPPKDERALRARALLARMIQEAGPVPSDYRPDETITEDGSEVPPEAAYKRQQNVVVPQRRRKNDPAREKEAQEFLERQRAPYDYDRNKRDAPAPKRRTTERRRGDEEESPRKAAAKTAPKRHEKKRGNYTEPSWATHPTEKYSLTVYKKKVLDHRIDLCNGNYHVVGRMTDCDIQIQNNSISRYHAVFQHGKDGMYIYDMGSSNGTFLNDHGKLVNDGIVPKRKYKRILSSDIIMFGEHEMFYVLEGGTTRVDFETAKRINNNKLLTSAAGYQFEDPRARERDYRTNAPKMNVRRDIRSARDHFRARYEDMQR